MTVSSRWRSYVVDELSLCNSYDTWHGKCIARVVMHIYMFTSCFTQSQPHIRAAWPTCTYVVRVITLYVCTIISGTKNAAKEIKTVCAGPKCTEGKIWFSELADKSMIFTSMHS